jgi:hypothetical protein
MTDVICFGLRSLFFILTECGYSKYVGRSLHHNRAISGVKPSQEVNARIVWCEPERFRVHQFLENHYVAVHAAVLLGGRDEGLHGGTRYAPQERLHTAPEIEVVVKQLGSLIVRETIEEPQGTDWCFHSVWRRDGRRNGRRHLHLWHNQMGSVGGCGGLVVAAESNCSRNGNLDAAQRDSGPVHSVCGPLVCCFDLFAGHSEALLLEVTVCCGQSGLVKPFSTLSRTLPYSGVMKSHFTKTVIAVPYDELFARAKVRGNGMQASPD